MICGEQKKGFGGARSLNGWDVSGGARMAYGHAGYGGADGCPAVGCRLSGEQAADIWQARSFASFKGVN